MRCLRPAMIPMLAWALSVPSLGLSQDDECFALAGYHTPQTARTVKLLDPAADPLQPAYLGVQLEIRQDAKVTVFRVEAGSPAEKEGIRVNDVLLRGDNFPIQHPDGLRSWLTGCLPGERHEILIEREGKTLRLSPVLGQVSRPKGLSPERSFLGVNKVKERYGGEGIIALEVTKDSPAERAGIRVGDVLLKMDGLELLTHGRLLYGLLEKKPGETVEITLRRENQELVLKVLLARDRAPAETPWAPASPIPLFKESEFRLAVLPISFPDIPLNPQITARDWQDALFSSGTYKGKTSATGQPVHGSLNDYYQEISHGRLRVTGTVFERYRAPQKISNYDFSNALLLFEARDALVASIGETEFKKYDAALFLYAGPRRSTREFQPQGGRFMSTKVSLTFMLIPEGGPQMESISVVAHELGHVLGLPDQYDRVDVENAGTWCTMAAGHGYTGRPVHFSAWCKEQLGWIRPAILDPRHKQKLILRPIADSPHECFKVLIQPDGSEYLLLENRVRRGFDHHLAGEGLLIWRVTKNKPLLEEAHGIEGPLGPRVFLSEVPYPTRGNNAFTPLTTPSSRSPRPGGLPVHLTNIQKLKDGRITFWIGYEAY